MIANLAAVTALPNQRVGTIDRPWRQDEPVFLSTQQAGPESAFATLEDAITGASYMSQTGKHSQNTFTDREATFVVTKQGDAFRAARLLVPVWKNHFGTDQAVDTALLRTANPSATGNGVALDFEIVRKGSYGSNETKDARGTLRLDASLGALAVVGNGWAFVDGEVRDAEAKDPFPPPPPPPPPPPAGGVLREAVDHVTQSIELIETVPVSDKGDASTKDARIGAYNANMAAQNVIEDVFLREDVDHKLVSTLREADAHLEDANWQLAKKPSPDGRFTGVDIPGALRDSHAALDLLTGVIEALPDSA
ncbi:MAG: hypothetical protein JWL76_1435 [Thermoleophilia bacterium]|nr:hypothetical protein [Thermoleophilia bacterium]